MAAIGEPTIDGVASAAEKALTQADGTWESLERKAAGTFHGGVQAFRMVTKQFEAITSSMMDTLPRTWAQNETIDTKQRIIPLPPLLEEEHVFPFLTMRWQLGEEGKIPDQSIHFCFVHGKDSDDGVRFTTSAIHFDSVNKSPRNEPQHWRFPHIQIGNRLPPVARKLDADPWIWPQPRLPRVPISCDGTPMQLLLTGLMSLYGTRISTWDLGHAPHGVKEFARELLSRAA